MPLNHYLCQTYEESLDSATALKRFSSLYTDFPRHARDYFDDLFQRCDNIPISIVLVEGALKNTPADKKYDLSAEIQEIWNLIGIILQISIHCKNNIPI